MAQIAVLQMTSGIDPEANMARIRSAAFKAGDMGAAMLFTPEMSLLLDRDRARAAAKLTSQAESPFVPQMAAIASETGIWIALGSMAVVGEGGKLANRSMVFAPGAPEPVCYDKMHMFDVDLADGESWRESSAYAPGERTVTVRDTPVGKVGLAVCYDMRFPALFSALGGCDTIAIPASFTVPTGQAHWHTLLRARAIEASAFVVAAAQVGHHEDGRQTYGHSLVVDPWGEVLLDMGGDSPGLGFASIDLARIAEVRRQVPSLANRRPIAS